MRKAQLTETEDTSVERPTKALSEHAAYSVAAEDAEEEKTQPLLEKARAIRKRVTPMLPETPFAPLSAAAVWVMCDFLLALSLMAYGVFYRAGSSWVFPIEIIVLIFWVVSIITGVIALPRWPKYFIIIMSARFPAALVIIFSGVVASQLLVDGWTDLLEILMRICILGVMIGAAFYCIIEAYRISRSTMQKEIRSILSRLKWEIYDAAPKTALHVFPELARELEILGHREAGIKHTVLFNNIMD